MPKFNSKIAKDNLHELNPVQNSRTFCVEYQNTRGLRTKTSHFNISILSSSADVFMIVETWLTDDFLNNELFPPGFSVFRCDRSSELTGLSRGGGVLLAIRNKHPHGQYRVYQTKFVDSCWLHVNLYGHPLWLGVIYVVPNASLSEYSLLFDFITSLTESSTNRVNKLLIVGDFNFPLYYELVNSGSVDKSVSMAYEFVNFVNYLNLKQLNQVLNINQRLLDLVFSSKDLKVVVTACLEPLVNEDKYHPGLSVLVSFPHKNQPSCQVTSSHPQYKFNKGNYDLLYSAIRNSDFSTVYKHEDVNLSVSNFYNIIYKSMDISIPKKCVSFDPNFPVWFNMKLIKLIKTKNFIRKKLKRNPDCLVLKQQFIKLRSTLRKDMKFVKKEFILNSESAVKVDPKKIWKFLRSMREDRSVSSISFDDQIITSPQDICNNFADLFKKSYKNNNSKNDPLNKPQYYPNFFVEPITKSEVVSALKKIKGSTVCGPDLLPSFILKGCGEHLVEPLRHIFNACLNSCIYPDVWKVSRISPVLKKGPKNIGVNYRPISILCATSKVFEIILFERMYACVKGSLSIHQHGFIKHRSTVSNLATYTNFIAKSFDKRVPVHSIYFDFSKAFDTVDHEKLLEKLSFFDIPYYLLRIIGSYLSNRSQFVKFKNSYSQPFTASSGVPQGSHLGPLLFVLFINDLPNYIKSCNILLYADDVKIFQNVSSLTERNLIQADIDNLIRWSADNNLDINMSKCQLVIFGKSLSYPNYNVLNHILEPQESVNDLGVIIDRELKFNSHVLLMVNRASKRLGMVRRVCFNFKDTSTFFLLFNAYVRPILEYASVIWNSGRFAKQDILIEKVQKKFLRYVYFRVHGQYPHYISCPVRSSDLLAEFGCLTLLKRREAADNSFIFKLLKNMIDAPPLLGELSFNVKLKNTRNVNLFSTQFSKTQVYKCSTIQRLMRSFNALSNSCTSDPLSMSLGQFKSKILK